MKRINKKGVSLAELLAVVVIMGIIAAIAIPLVGNVIETSKKKAFLGDATTIAEAVRTYCIVNNGSKTNYICDNVNAEGAILLDDVALAVSDKSENGKDYTTRYSGTAADEVKKSQKHIDDLQTYISKTYKSIVGEDTVSAGNGIWVKKDGNDVLVKIVGKNFKTVGDPGFINPADTTKELDELVVKVGA